MSVPCFYLPCKGEGHALIHPHFTLCLGKLVSEAFQWVVRILNFHCFPGQALYFLGLLRQITTNQRQQKFILSQFRSCQDVCRFVSSWRLRGETAPCHCPSVWWLPAKSLMFVGFNISLQSLPPSLPGSLSLSVSFCVSSFSHKDINQSDSE